LQLDHKQDSQKETVFHLLARLDPKNEAFPRILDLLSAHIIRPASLSSFTGEKDDGPTPLTLAIERGNRVMAQWLVDNGADVNFHGPGFSITNFRVARYSYPLSVAAVSEDPFFLELLLKKHARMDCQHVPLDNFPRSYNMTPLHLAAYVGRWENVSLLTYYGADVDMRCTPIDDIDLISSNELPTARQAVMENRYKHVTKVGLREALARFDRAVQEGLKRRRLLLLCGVLQGKLRKTVPHLPDHLVKYIFELAGLFPAIVTPEDQVEQERAEKYLEWSS
jgi:hypothetical protein